MLGDLYCAAAAQSVDCDDQCIGQGEASDVAATQDELPEMRVKIIDTARQPEGLQLSRKFSASPKPNAPLNLCKPPKPYQRPGQPSS